MLEALKSGWQCQIPVGAAVVVKDKLVFKTHNKNRFSHAEMLICEFVFHNNIKNYDLYITLEPCIMCWFSLHQTSIKRIFFGAYNLNYGGESSKITWKTKKFCEVFGGMEQEINQIILKSFFYHKRIKSMKIL
jgi:tRNA(adenine34) deaminase